MLNLEMVLAAFTAYIAISSFMWVLYNKLLNIVEPEFLEVLKGLKYDLVLFWFVSIPCIIVIVFMLLVFFGVIFFIIGMREIIKILFDGFKM